MALRSSHYNTLKVTQGASGPFARQLYKEVARVGRAWIAAARKDDFSLQLIQEHKVNVQKFIKNNVTRVMQAMHSYQMRQLDIDKSAVLYKRSRALIPMLVTRFMGDDRFVNATEGVLQRGFDLATEDKKEAIEYVKERTIGGIAQRRSVVIAEDLAHSAAQTMIQNIGEEDSNILAALFKGAVIAGAVGAVAGAAANARAQATQRQVQRAVNEARERVARGTKGATIQDVNQAASQPNQITVGSDGLEKPKTKLMKMWMSRRDNRVRPTHRVADGQIREMNETFEVGGFQLKYPGDPSAPFKERMNCRCSIKLVKRKI